MPSEKGFAMQYIDTHAHFDLCVEEGAGKESELVSGIEAAGIIHAVHVSIDAGGFSWAHQFASRHRTQGILFTLGIHPSSPAGQKELDAIERYAGHVMASDDATLLFGIGETGLDYYRLRRPKDEQCNSFEHQIHLAKKHCVPLIVHSRDATEDSLLIMGKYAPLRGIMHCFSEGSDYAKKFLDLGMYLSFAGNVTYKAAIKLQESAAYAPSDRLLLETDAPFLAPVPLRGKKNRPEFVIHTYQYVAHLRKVSEQELAHQINENFLSLIRETPRQKPGRLM